MEVSFAGKGGSGKTTIAATVTRTLARRGHIVRAIDGDSNPNLAIALGIPASEAIERRSPRRSPAGTPTLTASG